jgi:hypothetical protein
MGLTMGKTKLTLRIEKSVIELAKNYAHQHQTSLSQLVAEFFRTLDAPGRTPQAPILDDLTGILPADVSLTDYHTYLEQKYEQ